MQGWILRASLAAVLGLGVVAGLIRAGEPTYRPLPSAPAAPVQEVVPQPAYHSFPAGATVVSGPGSGPSGGYVSDGWERRRPLKNWLLNHNLGCWSHHNSPGCGSFHSDWNFVFGSCRTFYGEPCFRGPQQPPVPPGTSLNPGSGCRCP